MDQRTVRALENGGWFRNRRITRCDYDKQTANVGLLSPPQIQFIEEFGDLTVPIIRNGRPDTFWFDLIRAELNACAEWVEQYSQWANDRLISLGLARHGHLLVMMGTDASLYGGFDDFFVRMGEGPEEGLDWLVWKQDELTQ